MIVPLLDRDNCLKSHFYNGVRTHRPLNKDAPVFRSVQRTGVIRSRAILGGLHHTMVESKGFGTHTRARATRRAP
jgi:hypothetical protein